MKKFISLIGLLLFLNVAAFPQRPAQIRMGVTVPSVCSSSSSQQALFYKISSPVGLYQCVSGSYVAIGGGGSGEPVITGGTSGQFWDGTKTFRAVVQADVTGLKVADSPTFTGLNLSGDITQNADTNRTNIFGRARLDSRSNDIMYLSHYDMTGGTQYGFRQDFGGATYVNSPNSVFLAIGNSSKVTLDANGFSLGGMSATTIPLSINLAPAQTANAINVTSSGGSAGDLFKVDSSGVVKATGVDAPIRQNSQSTAYTLVLTDSGKHIFHPSADTTARTITIPANASVAFPIGTTVTFVNQDSAGVLTIAITTDTMRLAGSGATGSRTLAANGVATALKITSTEWIISGSGLS